MAAIAPTDLLDFLHAIQLSDERLFRLRQSFVVRAGLDEATIEAVVGILAAMRVAFVGDRFDLDVDGGEPEEAFVIGALDRYETIVDLVAWPVQRPAQIATYGGHASLLGLPNLTAYRLPNQPMPVFRTVARWLRAGGQGVVPLGARAGRALLEIDAPLLAEDDAHGAELEAMRKKIMRSASPILVADPRAAA